MTTITKAIKTDVVKLIKEGADRNKVEGFLLYSGVDKKEALGYLKELGLIGRKSFRQWLTDTCVEGFLSEKDMMDKLEEMGSDNEKRHIKTFNNERTAYNAIHAKYNEEIAKLVEEESKPAAAE